MISLHRTKTTVLLIGVVALIVFLIFKKPFQRNSGKFPIQVDPVTTTAQPTSATSRSATPQLTSDETPDTTTAKPLHDALAALKSATSADASRKILAELRAYLDAMPPELAAAAITSFLADPANNAPTRIDFSIGPSGFLDGHPSLRVALLDWLGQIAPRQAGVVASQILSTPTDADEWSVSLRNYARANPSAESNAFLRSKTEEMIRNPVWRRNPSIGYFEAFDVLVHTLATDSTELLSELVIDRSPEGKPLAHAAFLTLDRLTLRETEAMMTQFTTRPQLTRARGEMVANLMARADIREPEQQQILRNYLLDPARTASELNAFAGIYPNANFAISANLLSENITYSRDEIVARDIGALSTVNNWLADPSFAPVKSHLLTIQQRLKTFVQQAQETMPPRQ